MIELLSGTLRPSGDIKKTPATLAMPPQTMAASSHELMLRASRDCASRTMKAARARYEARKKVSLGDGKVA